MKTKFTKGNWKADLRGGCCAVYPENLSNETNGCHSYDKRNIFYSDKDAKYNDEKGCWDMSEEAQANAVLISAAPDMYFALENLLSELEDCSFPSSLNFYIHNAKVALNKAVGL